MSRAKPALLIAWFLWVCLIVYVGLRPFDWAVANGVGGLKQGSPLRFDAPALAYTTDRFTWGNDAEAGALSIELWLRPSREFGRKLGAVVSLHDAGRRAPLVLGQARGGVFLRYRQIQEPGYKDLGYADCLPAGADHHLGLTTGPRGTQLFVNGIAPLALSSKKQILPPGLHWQAQVVLGSSPLGRDSWSGELLGLALYARALAAEDFARHRELMDSQGWGALAFEPGLLALYDFQASAGRSVRNQAADVGSIEIPGSFRVMQPRVLGWGGSISWADLAANVVGFLPLGFLSLLVLGRRRMRFGPIVGAVLIGVSASLGIELAQAFMPSRDSSSLDLALNGAGTLLGALLGKPFLR